MTCSLAKHGHVHRIPIDQAFTLVDQSPRFSSFREQRLLSAIVFGVAGRELARPIDGET